MKKTLLVFDIDDTITKSEFQHQTAFVNAMIALGITDIDQNWGTYKNITDSFILKENFLRNLSIPFDKEFMVQFESEMMKNLLELPPTKEINGAAKMLVDMSTKSDYAICFATGSLLEPAITKLNQANIPYHKDVVVGSNHLFERESIVEKAIEKALRHYKSNGFEHIIAFGDGLWDLTTAENLGIHFTGIGEKNLPLFKEKNIKHWIKDWSEFDLKETERALEIG